MRYLQQARGLQHDRALVGRQVARQRLAAEVRLQQRVGLGARLGPARVGHRQRRVRQQPPYRVLFACRRVRVDVRAPCLISLTAD